MFVLVKLETEQKAMRMENTRKSVKNQSTVGQVGKEAQLVSIVFSND